MMVAKRRHRQRSRRRLVSDDPRIAAVNVMMAVANEHGSFRDRLPQALEGLSPSDRPRCQAWCFGLARLHIALAKRLLGLLDKPLKARDADLAWLLELGLYQLEHSDVPAPLVVSETVNAVDGLDNKSWARGLVNAVLRRALRERDAGKDWTPTDPATRYAFPSWLYQRLIDDWGDQASAIAEACNQQGPMTIRVAAGESGVATMQARLSEAGIAATPGQRAQAALVLQRAVDVTALPGFSDGDVSVQDESAQLAVELLAAVAPEGARLLDACAAPGGKTAHAMDSGRFGEIVALDNDRERLSRVSDTLQRVGGADTVTTQCADAAKPDVWWDGNYFDAVLLDAPCTGSGVIRRHPDIKLLRRASDVQALVEVQSTLLDSVWQVLKPGGYLLYATCSIFKAENEDQVDAFLKRHCDASVCVLPERAGEPRPSEATLLGRQCLPQEASGGDGFWYALLRRAEI